ncbi:MAG TPA: D-glucuronyl C5-epimerase family protein [Candidatus Dormibacteraeota bacterium]|nr:D-glucuronyl C5-epimerase family protein [Candidatus Dormibacteraeota bacterium]
MASRRRTANLANAAASNQPTVPNLAYYRRIFSAYVIGGNSHLTFWHETPAENANATPGQLDEYYMLFAEKADYSGAHDSSGIPQLDYHGHIGLQYNPIAIAQFGLGNYNLWRRTSDAGRKQKFFRIANWLCAHLEQNSSGLAVWNHHFNWEYRDTLRAPWYSALAQGQGISVLVRAHKESGDARYLDAARQAFVSFQRPMAEGGVVFTDESGDVWFEEYIVDPPTHILNGFIWALWGIYDYILATNDDRAQDLFSQGVRTLLHNLDRYDLGFWSLYEQSGTRLPMVASAFYHRLHIVQLRVMHRLTGEEAFARIADRWETYSRSRAKRTRALFYKSAFKLCYY